MCCVTVVWAPAPPAPSQGSGKTHTMFGPHEVLDPYTFATSDTALHGILPRAAAQLFDAMQRTERSVTFVCHVSYVEAYNDQLRDLLSKDGKRPIVLRESAKTGLNIEGLSHQLVSSPADVMRVVMRGNEHVRFNHRSTLQPPRHHRMHAVSTTNGLVLTLPRPRENHCACTHARFEPVLTRAPRAACARWLFSALLRQ